MQRENYCFIVREININGTIFKSIYLLLLQVVFDVVKEKILDAPIILQEGTFKKYFLLLIFLKLIQMDEVWPIYWL